MQEEDEECCPHCGGKDGYYFKSIQEYELSRNWYGDAEGAAYLKTVRETKPRCADCHKVVKPSHD